MTSYREEFTVKWSAVHWCSKEYFTWRFLQHPREAFIKKSCFLKVPGLQRATLPDRYLITSSFLKVLQELRRGFSLKNLRIATSYPVGIYLFKVNTRCEICPKLTIKAPVNFEHISHLVLVFLLLTLNM